MTLLLTSSVLHTGDHFWPNCPDDNACRSILLLCVFMGGFLLHKGLIPLKFQATHSLNETNPEDHSDQLFDNRSPLLHSTPQ